MRARRYFRAGTATTGFIRAAGGALLWTTEDAPAIPARIVFRRNGMARLAGERRNA
ncbi:hypothetical protein [Sphingomonas mollis]|uniref:hypothetical protein n=1 Tax=Sphingomonas mollis TaxID=2795726 RepID=UPI0018ED108B|nr:hypothetical protein [Sphingomonas sp. BT553]